MDKYYDETNKRHVDIASITLVDYLNKRIALKRLPEMNNETAIIFYQNLFEPKLDREKKQMLLRRNNDEQYLSWPYADRIAYLASKYQTLSKKCREYIVRCRESEIFWRGDEIEKFRKIVRETLIVRKKTPIEKAQYKKNILARVMAFKATHAN